MGLADYWVDHKLNPEEQRWVTDDAEIDWNSCRGSAKREAGPGHGTGGGLEMRDCTWPDPARTGKTLCRFNYADDCASFTDPPEPYSCRSFESTGVGQEAFYDACHVAPGDGRWPALKPNRQVITSYVSE